MVVLVCVLKRYMFWSAVAGITIPKKLINFTAHYEGFLLGQK